MTNSVDKETDFEESGANSEHEAHDEPINKSIVKNEQLKSPIAAFPLAEITQNAENKIYVKNPKTSDLVCEAINFLNERKGSSVHAIVKYIVSNNMRMDEKRLRSNVKKYILKAVQDEVLTQTTGTGASGSFKISDKTKKLAAAAMRKIEKQKLNIQNKEKPKVKKIKNTKIISKNKKPQPEEKQKSKQVEQLKSKNAADTAKTTNEPKAIAATTKRPATVAKQVNAENEAVKPQPNRQRKRKSIKVVTIAEPNRIKISKKLAAEKKKALQKKKGDLALESIQAVNENKTKPTKKNKKKEK